MGKSRQTEGLLRVGKGGPYQYRGGICNRSYLLRAFYAPASQMAQWQKIHLSIHLSRRYRRHKFNPWAGRISWRRKWQLTPVFLPRKSYWQKSLTGYSSWGWTWLSDWKVKESEVAQLCPTLCNPMDCIAYQAPPSMEFSRQEYLSGLPFPSLRDLPNPGSTHVIMRHAQNKHFSSLQPSGKVESIIPTLQMKKGPDKWHNV